MELSGHAPFIVYEDANIEKAVDTAMAAKYRNNGQVCISPSRFFIHEKVKPKFQDLFVKKTLKLKMGDAFSNPDLGPITTEKRLNDVEKLSDLTVKEGAELLCGGKRASNFNKGYYFEPTIFDKVKDSHTIMTEEPFSPLSPILSFKNFDEVIERANNHDNGLSSYVCTGSMKKAYQTADALETGMVSINTPVVAVAEAPFGGIKQSGYGREGGSEAIKDYLNTKYTHLGLEN
jgi:succinate-semialdehyde dehydrogenase/glutarate-semialdehyde dehydrogenase